MSRQTIYLHYKPTLFSYVFLSIGMVQALSSIHRFQSDGFNYVDLAFIISSVLIVIYAISMNPRVKLIPRVEIDPELIKIKPGFGNKTTKIGWSVIERIIFKSYRIEFLLRDGSLQALAIPRIADISLNLKKALREMSEKKNIEIERV